MRREDVIVNGKKQRYYYFPGKSVGELKYHQLCVSDTSSWIEDNLEIGDNISIGDTEYLIIDDYNEALKILLEIIKAKKPQTLEETCECIQEAVNIYFGDLSHANERVHFYQENPVDQRRTLSEFAHKNIAACAERAALSHILLHYLGIKSIFRMTKFTNNEGINDSHVYNLIESNGKYYLYDSTQPVLRNNIISPLIAEIPKEVFEGMKRYGHTGGTGLHVVHYNPMTNKDYDVVYNPGGIIYEAGIQEQKQF